MYYRETRNRTTGTTIQTCNAAELGYCTEGGAWVTVCEDHAEICNHDTVALARAHAAQPQGWCEGCRRIVYGPEAE